MRNILKCRFKKFYLILVLISVFSIFVIFYLSKFTLEKLVEFNENLKYQRLNERGRHSIPQIIGRYSLGSVLNLSQDFLNTNNYNPVEGEGEHGSPVIIPSRDLLTMQQLFQINRFNLLASDRMSVNRSLEDVRNNV